MVETKEADPEDTDGDLEGSGRKDAPDPRASASRAHCAKVDAETAELQGFDPAALCQTLREVIAGTRQYTTEALVRLCSRAYGTGDQKLVSLSFEAVAKSATGLLLSQAFGQSDEDRKDQVQEILLQLFAAIRAGKSRHAENFFAQFAKRRAIEQFRRRDARIEAKLDRKEPTEASDPLDELPQREPGIEARVLVSMAVKKLPPKTRNAFIQKYSFGMTKEEIAEQNGVDVRTVHNWLQAAREALGLEGGDDE